MNKELTLKEAAEHLGIHLQALRQRIRRRHLNLTRRQGSKGPVYVVTGEDLEKLTEPFSVPVKGLHTVYVQSTVEESSAPYTLNLHPPRAAEPEPLEGKGSVDPTEPNELVRTLAEVANKTLDQNRELERKLEHLQSTLLETLEQKARAERQSLSLANELSSYRRALSEHAESLAQERAQRLTLEHQLTDSMNEPALKLGMPTSGKGQGWGGRMRRWLGLQVG